MNSSRFKNDLYVNREIRDLKDMLDSCAELYADKRAYLVKDKPGGPYRAITYRQTKADVDGLGTALMDLGLSGKRVAVIGENRYEWVITYLATVNGTGVIVPLDRELPAGEIANLMERAKVDALVFSSKVERKVKEALSQVSGVEFVISMDAPEHTEASLSLHRLIERGKRLLAEGRRGFVDAVIDADEMRILLFTSGTTGLAKGVMLCHRNICANVYNMSKYVNVRDDCVGLSVLPMHHTYEFTCHIMTAMYQGCAVAICEGLKYIVKNMAEAQATVMLGVPLIFESMHKKVWKKAEASGKADKMRAAVAVSKQLNKLNIKATKKLFKEVHQALGGHMRLMIAGAAAIDPNVVEDFNAMGITMIQGYGMTENSPIIAVNMDRYHKAASAGLPMPGTQVRIIDKDENGVGEIICKGDSVMLGYYDDPEETAKVLIDGWLHTGDYGYFDRDGFLYITGRKKNVIVTKNGKNVFPEEVEFYLGKSDYIKEVIVSGEEDADTGEMIVWADILPNFALIEERHGNLPEAELRRLLKEEIDAANDKMPLYKRVKRFRTRDTEFEKTTTQKIKRYTAK
ncbi:AMP-dependent synthetase/ligase [Bacilliculturomica massiliensis]|uniref:AMP-dependent synthetase/ligase n=1 Tax=Bacilliculturomica massiliensis TaxID=1917867 RepID=UPI0010310902|nr:AMP-binding protein [Bacilliculturomica massiliensis]